MRLSHQLTLGPRGEVGVNPAATHKALESLPLLVDAATSNKCTMRFFNRGDGTGWISTPPKYMGGKAFGSRTSRARISGGSQSA